MGRLTVVLHKYQDSSLVRAAVKFLEGVDLPGEQKKVIAVSIVKLAHAAIPNQDVKWDGELEKAIEGGIEWVLAQVRSDAEEFAAYSPKVATPATTSPDVGV